MLHVVRHSPGFIRTTSCVGKSVVVLTHMAISAGGLSSDFPVCFSHWTNMVSLLWVRILTIVDSANNIRKKRQLPLALWLPLVEKIKWSRYHKWEEPRSPEDRTSRFGQDKQGKCKQLQTERRGVGEISTAKQQRITIPGASSITHCLSFSDFGVRLRRATPCSGPTRLQTGTCAIHSHHWFLTEISSSLLHALGSCQLLSF